VATTNAIKLAIGLALWGDLAHGAGEPCLGLQGAPHHQDQGASSAWVLRSGADGSKLPASLEAEGKRVCLSFQPAAGEALALGGPGWLTLPFLWPPEAAVKALPAVAFRVAFPQLPEDPGPAWIRLSPLQPVPGASANPVRYPVEASGGELRGEVPEGEWLGELVFARWAPVSLGPLEVHGQEIHLALRQPLTPASNLLLRFAPDRGVEPGLLAQGRLKLVPQERAEDLWCAFVAGTVEQLEPFAPLEVDGTAFLAGAEAGEYLLAALFPGQPPFLGGPVAVPRGAGLTVASLPLGWGRLRFQVPELVPLLQIPRNRATVELAWMPAERSASRCMLSLPFDALGEAPSPSLPYGTYRAFLVVRALEQLMTGVASSKVSVHLEGEQPLGFQLGKVLRGQVLYDGKPAQCLLQLTLLPKGGTRNVQLLGWSGSDGRFALLGAEEGDASAELRCLQPAAKAEIPWLRVTPKEQLRLTIPTASIQGVLLDRQGFPLGGQTIVARWMGSGGEGEDKPPYALLLRDPQVQSKEDGSFAFHHMPAGTWLLEARLQGKGRASKKVSIADGEAVRNLVLREEGELLQLVLVHEDGTPVREATVAALALTTPRGLGERLPFLAAQATTASDGSLELPWTLEEVRELQLEVATPAASLFCTRVLQLRERTQVVVPASWGEVELRWSSSGEKQGFPSLKLFAADGASCDLFFWSQHPSQVARWYPEEGRLRVRLSPGTYRLFPPGLGPEGPEALSEAANGRQGALAFSLGPGQRVSLQLP